MGIIGYGYGSEWHLLRYLGYHRDLLNEKIKKITGAEEIRWLDAGFSGEYEPLHQDREFEGLNFLPAETIPATWREFWPQTGAAPNWDAVARLRFKDGGEEWLLIEAKAHIGEFNSACQATNAISRKKIESAIHQTIEIVGASSASLNVWMNQYYQYANRLAVLAFLNNMLPKSPSKIAVAPPQTNRTRETKFGVKLTPEQQARIDELTMQIAKKLAAYGIPTRLLYICFCGDTHSGCDCPKGEAEWKTAISEIEARLGIHANTSLMEQVHHLFVPVSSFGQGVLPYA